MLNEEENLKILDFFKEKIARENVLTFYSLAKLYKLPNVIKSSLIYIERCFQMVVETQNFLHLDFSLVARLLESSELNIHSEVEVFIAAITWLKFNIKERSKYANQLLLKVRLNLLSEHALKYILGKISSITEINECVNKLKEGLADKSYFKNKSNIFYTSRYCGQINFNLLICGGYDYRLEKYVSKVNKIDGINMNCVEDLKSMTECRCRFESICIKGEVYIFGGFDNAKNPVKIVEKYLPIKNEWTVVTNMFDKRSNFCACSFMDKILVFGGSCIMDDDLMTINSCLQFDTKEEIWKKTANMDIARMFAACVDFQGNIIVSGGLDNNEAELNTVESYDVFANKWTSMPNMINPNYFHRLVTVKNKLLVISDGRNKCEVFDNVCKKFVALQSSYTLNLNKAMSIGNKIIIFQHRRSSVILFDVDKNEWSEEPCEVTKDLGGFNCVKMPKY